VFSPSVFQFLKKSYISARQTSFSVLQSAFSELYLQLQVTDGGMKRCGLRGCKPIPRDDFACGR